MPILWVAAQRACFGPGESECVRRQNSGRFQSLGMFLGVLDMSLRAPIDWYKLLGAIFKSQKVDLTPITL